MKIATALLALASFGAALGFAGQANPPAGTDQTQTTTKTKTKKHRSKKSKKGATTDTTGTSTTK